MGIENDVGQCEAGITELEYRVETLEEEVKELQAVLKGKKEAVD